MNLDLSRYFRVPGRKESRANRAILLGLPMPGPVDHLPWGRMSRDTYERNAAVHACVSLIARACAGVPWVLMERPRAAGARPKRRMTERTATKAWMHRGPRAWAVRKALETTEIEAHPALELVERPNPGEAKDAFIERLASYLLLAGNSYQEFLAPSRKGAAPMETYVLRPDRTRVVPSAPGPAGKVALVGGYEYKVDQVAEIFEPESVIHFKFFHPTDDWYGLSPLQVAYRAAQTDNLAADWNYALIKNDARPSGALVVPTVLPEDSYRRVKEEIEESYQGADAAGLPLLLEGGLKWEPLGLSPLELDWLSGRKDARVEICNVYHTPPELIGDSEHKTYNSFPEARLSWWEEANLPLLDRLRDVWNARVTPVFGDRLFLDYDRDQIEAIQEEQEKLWNRVARASHVSINEKREATGYDQWGGDAANDPPQDVPVGLLPKAAAPGAPGEPAPGAELTQPAPAPGAKSVDPETLHQDRTARVAKAEARLRAKLRRMFGAQGRELARLVREAAREMGE